MRSPVAMGALIALPVLLSCGTKTTPSSSASGGSVGTGGDAAGSGSGGASAQLLNPAPGTRSFAGANFWNVEWERSNVFLPDVDFTTTDNPWVPQMLTDLAPYKVLRLMDWNGANSVDNPQAHFATRRKKTEFQDHLVAFEWQIDLCNRTKKDYWLNVPHESSPEDWKAIAELVRDQLDPSLRLYLEFSNEMWNESFPQNAYATAQAKALSLEGEIPAASYYVYSSVRLFEAFSKVFASNPKRLVRVLAGFSAWSGPCEAHVVALSDTAINPEQTKPDFYAIAPYAAGESVAALTAQVSEVAAGVASNVACAEKMGLQVIGYEGGSDAFSLGDGCAALQHDAGMRQFYVDYLKALTTAGLRGPYMQYTHSGACWGLKEKVTDSLEASPKYQGLLDWLESLD